MDARLNELTQWQLDVYDLCWQVGLAWSKEAADKLDRMKLERPEEYEKAFEVWKDIMFDLLN